LDVRRRGTPRYRDHPQTEASLAAGNRITKPEAQKTTAKKMNTEKKNQKLAIVSLILGIAGLVCLGPLTAIPAIITGHLARNRARRWPDQHDGNRLAITGLSLGYTTLANDPGRELALSCADLI
jgi:hypothetical protein